MATKRLQITNKDTGEIIEELEFTGGYHIIYTNTDDFGYLRHIKKLDNAKFGDKHWIKNWIYRPIVEKLIKKFPELKHIDPYKILFIEDMEWKKPNNSKKQWMARVSKCNKQFSELTGYDYVIETRNYYIERMQQEQIIALLYHELRHIGPEGDIVTHDIEDWENLVATLGKDWVDTKAKIKNLIDDDICWKELEPAAKQLEIFELKVVK